MTDSVYLGEVISEFSKKNKSLNDYPVYSVTNERGFCRGYFSKDVSSNDRSNYKIVPRGYFAYNPSRINVGSIDWQNEEDNVIVSPLYVVFKTSDKIIQQYLLYYLKSDIALAYIRNSASGSVRDNLKFSSLKQFKVKLPQIEEQQEIVDVLDNVCGLIDNAKNRISDFEILIKSRFVEIFGNPIQNPMSWNEKSLAECLDGIDNGKSFVCDNVPRIENKPAVLKLSAATFGFYQPEENKAMLDESNFVDKAEVHKGDLLFTRKNTPELVGMSAYVFETPEKLMMPDLIFRLNTKDIINKIYLWQLINHELFRSKIQALAGGSAKSMSNISKERLLKLKVPVPPMELQKQFAEFVEQVEKAKAVIKEQLAELETLKKSLMQKYFG